MTAGTGDAVVVGAGPNGLAAAVTLAQAGLSVTVFEGADEIGGGTRTAELTVPGVLHDVCSAVHPFGIASPFLASLPLADHGLEWRWPEIDLAHPLDGGRAGVMMRSLDDTVAGLGPDGPAWRRTFGPLLPEFEALTAEALAPVVRVPRRPVLLARFGLRAGLPASLLARRFRTDEARALWAGNAAHVWRPFNRPATSAVGVLMTAGGHRFGWPVAAGGSHAIAVALAGLLVELGGSIQTGARVTALDELPPAGVTLLDVAPRAVVEIAGARLPARTRRAYARWRHAPAAFKVDLGVEGGIPWTAEPCRRAGTVHVGGTYDEIAAAEADIQRDRMPDRPFVLVGQQYLSDPQRSNGDVHPVWAYAHVPRGYAGDATDAVLGQIERFAPGARERIVGRHILDPAALEAYNPNHVGGDIINGDNTLRQLVLRPRVTLHPYATGIPGVYLCSAATPPGAGVHGMCGHHAARYALRGLGRPLPSDG
ncbi:MAG: phytoene desaturase family protein [Acidimicrobiales bacterium]